MNEHTNATPSLENNKTCIIIIMLTLAKEARGSGDEDALVPEVLDDLGFVQCASHLALIL